MWCLGAYIIINDTIHKRMIARDELSLSGMPLEKLSENICEIVGVDLALLTQTNHSHQICLARSIVAYFAHHFANYQLSDIAIYFDISSDALSKNMYRHITKPKNKSHASNLIDSIKCKLSLPHQDSFEK